MSVLVVEVKPAGMRGLLFSHTGTLEEQKQIFYQSAYSKDRSRVEQDPMEYKAALWEILEWTGEKRAAKCEELDVIDLVDEYPGLICVGENRETIGNAICWQVSNSTWECGEILNWIRNERSQVYENTWKLMSIASYLAFLMTGETRTGDTTAARTPLFDRQAGKWDPVKLELFHLEQDKLCEIIPADSEIGALREEAARLTGLPEAVPVFANESADSAVERIREYNRSIGLL